MPDAAFDDPRLAVLYDALDDDRSDLAPYLALATSLGARSVLDVGCGTGTLALLLDAQGLTVTGLDPAAASLDVARGKPEADAVTWLHGDATSLALPDVDLAVMTGNVVQAILGDAWPATLRALAPVARHLVLESRVPAARAWERWTPELTRVSRAGVTAWCRVLDVALPLVTFEWTYELPDATLTSRSTLQFRSSQELTADVEAAGFEVVEVREAPHRPGLEHVLVCRAVL